MLRLASVIAILAFAYAPLFGASSASSAISRDASLVPTRAAIANWKSFALKPSHLTAYWRGYLPSNSFVTMKGCHLDASRGVTSYQCLVKIVDTPLAFAYLFRTGTCDYGYLIGTMDGSRQFHRFFHYCG